MKFRGLIKWARGILRKAQRDLATNPGKGFGSAVVPFDSHLNIYDRDVYEVTRSLVVSRGDDEYVLNAAVNRAIGRKVVPENSMDTSRMELIIEQEDAALKERMNRG